jgi:hypothetical protein
MRVIVARNARTGARSCGSPTSTAIGSPPSPRAPGVASSPSWNCGADSGRCEERIRCAKDTGLRNLPLKGFAQNQLWCEIVPLAWELLAWTRCSPANTRYHVGVGDPGILR